MERLNYMPCELIIKTIVISEELPDGEITIDQIKNHVEAFRNMAPFDVEGLIVISDSLQGTEMSGYIGSLWQQVITALEELLENDVATFHCPAEVSVCHKRNSNKDVLLWYVEGFGTVEYDFIEFVYTLFDAAQIFFSTVTEHLAFLTQNQSDDDFGSYGSYDYSHALDYLNRVRVKYKLG